VSSSVQVFGPVTGLPLAVIENAAAVLASSILVRESNRNDLRRIHAGRASAARNATTEGTTWVDAVSGVIVANGAPAAFVHDSGAEARDIGGSQRERSSGVKVKTWEFASVESSPTSAPDTNG